MITYRETGVIRSGAESEIGTTKESDDTFRAQQAASHRKGKYKSEKGGEQNKGRKRKKGKEQKV